MSCRASRAQSRFTLMLRNSKAPRASVLTTESFDEMDLAIGDEVRLVVKAVNVLPVKE